MDEMNDVSSQNPDNGEEMPAAASETARTEQGSPEKIAVTFSFSGSMLWRISGLVMVVGSLLNWLKGFEDAFPNVSGVSNVTTGAPGLFVLLLGLVCIFHKKIPTEIIFGAALGALAAVLIYIVRVGNSAEADGFTDLLGIGPWIALAGTALAVVTGIWQMGDHRKWSLPQSNMSKAALGASLAVVASFWLEFPNTLSSLGFRGDFLESGLNTDVLLGMPILILGGVVLLLVVGFAIPNLMTFSQGNQQNLALVTVICGSAIAAIGASEILASGFIFFSGPVVALIGGVLMLKSASSESASAD